MGGAEEGGTGKGRGRMVKSERHLARAYGCRVESWDLIVKGEKHLTRAYGFRVES